MYELGVICSVSVSNVQYRTCNTICDGGGGGESCMNGNNSRNNPVSADALEREGAKKSKWIY